MTRKRYQQIIMVAHERIHLGDIEGAHDALHIGLNQTDSMTTDPEVQKAVGELIEMQKGKLPCGHTIGDLIGGKGAITKCGACVAERQKSLEPLTT